MDMDNMICREICGDVIHAYQVLAGIYLSNLFWCEKEDRKWFEESSCEFEDEFTIRRKHIIFEGQERNSDGNRQNITEKKENQHQRALKSDSARSRILKLIFSIEKLRPSLPPYDNTP
jgi:hypothetical protein